MPGEQREGQFEPITPLRDGRPPAWVVRCLTCGFAHDAHGPTESEAIQSIAAAHEPGHRLAASRVDYTTGWGPNRDEPHPLYRP